MHHQLIVKMDIQARAGGYVNKKNKKQEKQYRDSSGRIFEFVSEGVQQSETSYGSHITTYPATILRNVETGELVSVLSNRLNMAFSPHYTGIKTQKDAKKYISILTSMDLSTVLSAENYTKLDETAQVLSEQHIKKWYREVEPHPDFVGAIKNAISDVLISIVASNARTRKSKDKG